MPTLFDPITVGAIACANRIFMAPLTRGRASPAHVPTPLMAAYYRQRASAGLIISEATAISRQGMGWVQAPGIWSQEQVEAWKLVTKAVHEAGGRIVCQLWHMGRIVHPDFLDGEQAVSASAIAAPGGTATPKGRKTHETPRALTLAEIPHVIETYAAATRNARAAGFDGVQLHGANGYLIDQFLRDSSNHRTDAYGGPIANRVRFLREATEAAIGAWDRDHVAVRLSPDGNVQGCVDSNQTELFKAAVQVLSDLGIAFLELREGRVDGTMLRIDKPSISPELRKIFKGPLVVNSDYGPADAPLALAEGRADAVSFGRPFLANPDLPARLKVGAPLNQPDMATAYTDGPKGYTDYPTLAA